MYSEGNFTGKSIKPLLNVYVLYLRKQKHFFSFRILVWPLSSIRSTVRRIGWSMTRGLVELLKSRSANRWKRDSNLFASTNQVFRFPAYVFDEWYLRVFNSVSVRIDVETFKGPSNRPSRKHFFRMNLWLLYPSPVSGIFHWRGMNDRISIFPHLKLC